MFFVELWFNKNVKVTDYGFYCNHKNYIFHNILDAINKFKELQCEKHLKEITLDHVFATGTGAWTHETIVKRES